MTQKAIVTKDGVNYVDLTAQEIQQITDDEQLRANNLPERQKNAIRRDRKNLLEEADFKINTLVDNNQDATAWRVYRQALRDMTNQSDLANPVYPTKPD